MGENVYVDLFFLINFSMDFLCFFLTARLLNRSFSTPRVIAASVLGGLYADVALFFSVGRLLSLSIDVAVCVFMCLVAFGEKKRMRTLPLYVLIYTAVSMALGGMMTALFRLFNRSSVFGGIEEDTTDGISVWAFFLLALISGLLTYLGGRFFRKKTAQTDAEIEVVYDGRCIHLCAMVDNGNLLRDPISGKPCIVADLRAMEEILPRELILAARRAPVTPEKIPEHHAKRIRLVPTNTAAGHSLLLALRPEQILLHTAKETHPIDAMIALTDLGMGANKKEALLPSQLLV